MKNEYCMDLSLKRNQIIDLINRIRNEDLLSKVEEFVITVSKQKQKDIFQSLTRPMKNTLQLEDMMVEQNFKGADKQRIDKIIKEINIEQSTDELLAMI